MSSTFSETNLVKKLEQVTNSQDSIQTLSLWVLHHKNHYKQIVEQWLKCYLKAKSSHQLALFYLANDIVQHAKRKSLTHYLNEFMKALREASKVTNDEKIIPNITRVFNIWQERSIYNKEFIQELRELLCGETVKLELISKIVSDFSLPDVINQINNVVKMEQITQTKLQGLVNCKVDFTNSDLLNNLKDKTYGEQFTKEYDEATKCLESVILTLEKEITSRNELLSTLEKSNIFYDIQMKEAKTVAEAFNNCELRVKQVQAKLGNCNNNVSSPDKANQLSTENITTSQLSSVLNLIKQARTSSTSVSSLDQRLTNLMNSSGQFGLNVDQDNRGFNSTYNQNLPTNYNPTTFDSTLYSGQFYLPNNNNERTQIESSLPSRHYGIPNQEHTENLEPADMDLGNSDDDDNINSSNVKNIKVIEMNKNSMDHKLRKKTIDNIPFMPAQEIGGIFPLIPPPPPPPMPPPFKELFGSALEGDLDSFRNSQNIASISNMDQNLPQGNSIRSLADRPSQYQSNSGHWRSPPDNRQMSRNQNYSYSHSNNGRYGNRWKNNNNNNNTNPRGSRKRNSYGGGGHH